MPRALGLISLLVFIALAAISAADARTVYVKYRGEVSVDAMDCIGVTRSSFIHEVCYHAATGYMLIQLNSSFYHYCELDAATYDGLMAAPSMGRFFNANIKGRFDCRVHGAPDLG